VNAPLYTALINYGGTKEAFHMPGHKLGKAKMLKDIEALKIDNTEAMGLDHLYHAQGVIQEAMQLMARFYKAQDTFFLTNGATAGILASIISTVKEGEKIIVSRNCHHSIWNALILSGAKPIYMQPKLLKHPYIEEGSIVGEIRKEDIKEALDMHPDAKAVLIVSPTYEGVISDIKEIAKEVHKAGKILIVDEAHGAHFCLEGFPKSSIELGADIVINSMHKTLPTLTQSALLHIGSDRVDKKDVLSALEMIQTSSPSYMMMGIMDYVRSYIEENQYIIKKEYTEPLLDLRKELKNLRKLRLVDINNQENNVDKIAQGYDISKIVLSTLETSITGYELADRLYQDYDIGIEAAFNNHIILITSFSDTSEGFHKLKEALFAIDKEIEYNKDKTLEYNKQQDDCKNIPKGYINDTCNSISEGIPPRTIYYAKKEWTSLDLSVGKVFARSVMLYPPGIPIGAVGEYIDDQMIQTIKRLKDKLIGIRQDDGEIKVYVSDLTKEGT
jgi:arginine/lysine/ornithine decarboxylase